MDCEEALNHVANCRECIEQILLHREDTLSLPHEEIDRITLQRLQGKN